MAHKRFIASWLVGAGLVAGCGDDITRTDPDVRETAGGEDTAEDTATTNDTGPATTLDDSATTGDSDAVHATLDDTVTETVDDTDTTANDTNILGDTGAETETVNDVVTSVSPFPSGPPCTRDGFCATNPVPAFFSLTAIVAFASNDVFFLGNTILHFDGRAFTGLADGRMPYIGEVAADGRNLVATSQYGTAMRIDLAHGTWTSIAAPAESETYFTHATRAGTRTYVSATDFEGSDRIYEVTAAALHSVLSVPGGVTALHGRPDGTLYIGSDHAVLTWKGSGQPTAIPATDSPTYLWGCSERVFVTIDGCAYELEGTTFTFMACMADSSVGWAPDCHDLFLSGHEYGHDSGLGHFDGETYERIDPEFPEPLQDSGYPTDISALGGTSTTDLWGAGTSTLFHYDGQTYTHYATTTRASLSRVGATPPVATNAIEIGAVTPTAWVGGDQMTLRRSGETWEAFPIEDEVRGIVAFDGNRAVALGAQEVWHFEGTEWTPDSGLPAMTYYTAGGTRAGHHYEISATAPDNIWIVGNIVKTVGGVQVQRRSDELLHFDGYAWATVDVPHPIWDGLPSTPHWAKIHATDGGEIVLTTYAFGPFVVIASDGTLRELPRPKDFTEPVGIAGTSMSKLVILDGKKGIAFLEGSAEAPSWRIEPLAMFDRARALSAAPDGTLWALGSPLAMPYDPAVFRRGAAGWDPIDVGSIEAGGFGILGDGEVIVAGWQGVIATRRP